MKQNYLLILALLTALHFQAQDCSLLMEPVSISQRSNESSLIIEGEVISSKSQWDINHHNIYTVHEIKVYKKFKGTKASTIFVETLGGSVNEEHQTTSSTAKLKVGDVGVFFVKASNAQLSISQSLFKFVAAAQGAIKYNKLSNKPSDVFEVYNSIDGDLFPRIEKTIGSKYEKIQERPEVIKVSRNSLLLAIPVITSFTPTTATAGTETIVTITGSSFGTTLGQVLFPTANDGGATYTAAFDSQVVSWNDTTILVKVPHTAGTGFIQVMNTDGTITSTEILTVPYSHSNATTTSNVAYPTTIESVDGSFTFTYHEDFDTSAAKPYFEQAFHLWNCESGINFEFGATTTTDITADDGINIIRFDNGAELPTGTLGRVTSRFTSVCNGTGDALTREMDITWNDDFNFYYGDGTPSLSQYDFKTVALHELGHAHKLNHIINSNNIMHYVLGPGVSKFNLSTDDIDGANYTMSVFTAAPQCSRMTEDSECIYVPDNNFEDYLEANGMGNGIANDDTVFKTNISGVTTLDVSGQNISDLTGIESFVSLQSLNCSSNLFTSVDLSKNALLETLNIQDGALNDLDVTENTALINLYCQDNNLASLDLIHNGALSTLECYGNNLTTLNVTQNVNLLELNCSDNSISSLNLTQNTLLENLNFSQNSLTNLDVSQSLNLEYLIADYNDITTLNVAVNTALKELSILDNDVTTLDLNTNVALEKVNANGNNLDYLNIANGNNVAITEFTATGNTNLMCINIDDDTQDLSSWDKDPGADFSAHCYETYVPDNNFETYLEANDMGNGIANDDYVTTTKISIVTDLDVKSLSISDLTGIEAFTALKTLNAKTNTIGTIDLSNNTALTSVDVSSNDLVGLLDLTANTNLANIDCEFNDLTSLDITGLTALLTLDYEGNSLTSIDVTTNIALTEIRGDDTTIGNIDLSKNTLLETLRLDNAGLNSIDLSNNLLIRTVRIGNNNLTSIDVSSNPEIYSFHVNNNQLTYLDIKNGNNTNIPVIFFNTQGNPNLACINVDSVIFSNGNWPLKDNTSAYGENCYATTYVPDNNFEDYLEANAMGNGVANDDHVLTSAIENVTSLNVSGKSISDLTGIEDFTALTFLNVSSNSLTSIDVTQNILLEELSCGNNQLTTLDVSQNTQLDDLNCNQNQLTSLNVSQNVLLEQLDFSDNQLTNLDVSQNTQLFYLSCDQNELTSLNVTTNTLLEDFYFDDNELTSIDLSENLELKSFTANNNELTSLDVSQNVVLEDFEADTNQLTYLNLKNGNNTSTLSYVSVTNNPNLSCIEVDDAAAAALGTGNYSGWDKDNVASYSESCRTYVPDDNFEDYLETHDASGNTVAVGDVSSMGNGVADDDYVSTDRIENVTTLNFSFSPFTPNADLIADMTGIEDFLMLESLIIDNSLFTSIDISQNSLLEIFTTSNGALTNLDVTQNTALTSLSCSDNDLSSLDVSQNINLTFLACSRNNLTNLDVLLNTSLEKLICYGNSITVLDVTQNIALNNLSCHINNLSALDLTQNNLLEELYCDNNALVDLNLKNGNNALLDEVEIDGNPNLTCVLVDDAVAANDGTGNYSSWEKDAQTSYNDVSCVTYVPDDNFENYLETHDASGNIVAVGALSSMGNGIADDDYVSTDRIENVTTLNFSFSPFTPSADLISDMTGIEGFLALESLDIYKGLFTSIDLSQNTLLETLELEDGALTTLDVTQNIALINLNCENNSLTTLDVTPNINLTNLNCGANNLTNLDVSLNTNLVVLSCDGNDLTNLDVSLNTNLVELKCDNNDLSILDVTKNLLLEDLNCDSNNLSIIDVTQNSSLASFYCDNNILTTVNVTQNTQLEEFSCTQNQLTSIDVSQNTALVYFYCEDNQLINLDVSQNNLLEEFYCYDNALQSLNLKNGNNTSITDLDIQDNPNLTCVQVDDAAYSNTNSNWENKDAHSVYNTDCRQTDVPDNNFENYLETHDASGATVAVGNSSSMGNGIADDNYVYTSRIENVLDLDVSNKTITDLTGIEGFVALTSLDCSRNQITNLDVSQNIALINLDCGKGQLTSLDVTQSTLLETLDLHENASLSTLDITQNTALKILFIPNCQFSTLDISQNVNLEEFDFGANNFTTLDVSQNSKLESLSCYENNLTAIDVTQNALLKYLYVEDNQITSLDVSQNTALVEFFASDNDLQVLNAANGTNIALIEHFFIDNNPNLTCVQVDDASHSTANWPDKDAQTSYSVDCSAKLNPLVFLQGAMLNPNSGEENLMRDDLRIAGLIPTTSPYADGTTCDPSVFNTTGNFAIVDWVWVELRDANDNTSVVESRSALLTRNGTVVDVDGTPSLSLNSWAMKYYVAIKHRNHLGIMTLESETLDFILTPMDFSDGSIATYGTNAQTSFGMPSGINAMWTGDTNGDNTIVFSGSGSDANSVKDYVLDNPSNILNFLTIPRNGYSTEDIYLDGTSIFSGSNNDSNLIKDNVLDNPSNILNFLTIPIGSKIPE